MSAQPTRERSLLLGIGAVAIALAAFGAWFATRPAAAFSALQEATRARDVARVSEYVDFPALRESLKARLHAQLANQVAQAKNRPFAALGAMLGATAVEPVVERVVSPMGLAMALNGASLREQMVKNNADAPPRPNITYTTSWAGLDRYRVTVASEGRAVVSLVLTRSGLATWRLTDLE